MEGNKTWVKIYRSLEDWEWYTDYITKSVYLHLLLKANHKDHKFKGMLVKRGSIVTGRKKLAERLGLSEQQIRTSLHRLKSTSYITTKSTNKFTLVTLINYDKYQNNTNNNNKSIDSNQPTNNQQITNNQPQYKNDKNDKNISTTTIEEINKKIKGNISLINNISKRLNKTINIIEEQIPVFAEYIFSVGKIHTDDQDLFSHFSSWINKQDLINMANIDELAKYYINIFNQLANTKYRVTKTIKELLSKALDDGFNSEQMKIAIKNMRSSDDRNWHKKTRNIHATPEHLLKDNNLNKYLNQKF